MAAEGSKIIIKLKAIDGTVVEVEQDVAFMSNTIKKMCEDLGVQENFEIDVQVTGPVLTKVIEWCNAHRGEVHVPKAEDEDQRIELTDADNQYMDIPDEELVNVLNAADFLDIQGMIDIITQKIANMIKGKTTEEIREIYGFEDDLTPEEKEEIRKKYEWVEA